MVHIRHKGEIWRHPFVARTAYLICLNFGACQTQHKACVYLYHYFPTGDHRSSMILRSLFPGWCVNHTSSAKFFNYRIQEYESDSNYCTFRRGPRLRFVYNEAVSNLARPNLLLSPPTTTNPHFTHPLSKKRTPTPDQ